MKQTAVILILAGAAVAARAQSDSAEVRQDAVYDRPFTNILKTTTAVGGYLEGNTNYFAEDGVPDGFTMEMRRFNIFLYANISERIRFLSELEFEHGTEEIALETAMMDFEFNDALNFRGGVILPQIGYVNANHDSPKWDFVERPLSSTQIIPSTLSEIGFGLFGKFYPGAVILSYDLYAVNGLQDNVLFNGEGKTFIPAGKTASMMEEDNNGRPMYNVRLAAASAGSGEIGFSWYGGTYNTFRVEGEEVEEPRNLYLAAVDLSTTIGRLDLRSEVVRASVDVAGASSDLYGSKQWGMFLDLVYPLLRRSLFGFEKSVLNAGLRFEHIDYYTGNFSGSGEAVGDEVTGGVFALSWRPVSGTVIRGNFRYHFLRDYLGNTPALLAGFQFGLASYF